MSKDPKQPAGPPQPAKLNLLPKVINGGIAGIIGVSVVFPLDLVKTRLQNQPIGPKGERQYKNMLDCFKQTYKAEGYFGMYRGSAVNIILITPEKAIKLSGNDIFRYYLTTPDGKLQWYRQMLAGGMAGACQIVITTPMELLKIQMQDQGRMAIQAKKEGKEFKRTTAMELTKKLLAERGFVGLYKGIGATACRDIFFSVVYFPLFAELNNLGPRKANNEIPFYWSFISGISAGACSAVMANPMDVVKTRLQAGIRSYSGMADAYKQTLQQEGPAAFFKGGLCRIIVIAPLFGIAQSVYYMGIAEYLLGMK